MALSCGVGAGALGKGDLSAPGTEPESGWGIRLSGRMHRGGPGLWVGRGSASPGGVLLQNFQLAVVPHTLTYFLN